MSRPMPNFPRGARRKREVREQILLGLPALCPKWSLAAVRALMKPQTRDAIAHKQPVQKVTSDAKRRIVDLTQIFAGRTGGPIELHFPRAGDYRIASSLPSQRLDDALALAVLLSRITPKVWWTVDRLFILDGEFFRRQRGYGLVLVPATNVSLSRPMRSLVRRLTSEFPPAVRVTRQKLPNANVPAVVP